MTIPLPPHRKLLIAICSVHAALLGYGASVHSPTYNEPAHLTAGISYWQFGRFDVYSVNPPLVKMVAALPVLAAGCETDWSAFYAGPGARPEMALGEAFVHANGERALWLMTLARWACLPFSLLGALVCYCWARDLVDGGVGGGVDGAAGVWAGTLAASLWCFSPSILGHGQLMTPDVHASALGAAACYAFWRWLQHPTWLQTFVTGFVLGLAELAKTTLVLFYPLWPLLWIAYRLLQPAHERPVHNARGWLREAGMLAVRMAVGIYALNLGYGFEGSLTPLRDYHFVSDLFAGGEPRDSGEEGVANDDLTRRNAPHNRFAESWLGRLPVPFPKHYLVGIDLQQRDFESYGHRSYMAGTFQDGGWLHYYLYVLAVKAPLGMWGLAALATLCAIRQLSAGRGVAAGDQALVLAIPAILFAVVSFKCGFSEHGRYILPCYPLFFIWTAAVLTAGVAGATGATGRRLLMGGVACLLVWTWGSVGKCYPHTLSYFNEAAGGSLGGPRHLLHSNIDWGQDLAYLRRWLADHPEAQPLRVALFSGCNPADIGFADTLPLAGATPDDASVPTLEPGWYAVSVNLLYGYGGAARDGAKPSTAAPSVVSAVRELTPVARAGYSIYIYRVERAMEVRVRECLCVRERE
jgi:hypothetical protein